MNAKELRSSIKSLKRENGGEYLEILGRWYCRVLEKKSQEFISIKKYVHGTIQTLNLLHSYADYISILYFLHQSLYQLRVDITLLEIINYDVSDR